MPKIIKVLTIEDSPVVRNLLRYKIESQPEMKVLGAVSGGAEALSFLAKSPIMPDVITTDMNMPKMDGYEAAREIRKFSKTIPIIAVGGIMTADDAIEKLKAGASLVQLYTGFIYEGPDLIKEINLRLLK